MTGGWGLSSHFSGSVPKNIVWVNHPQRHVVTGISNCERVAETPILWPPDAKNWLTGKDPDAGWDWRQEEKGMTEEEVVGRHYWFDGCEFEQAPGVGDGQGGLECCSPWGHKELDRTEQLNWLIGWSPQKTYTHLRISWTCFLSTN